LGQHDHVDRVEIHWLGGGVDVLNDPPADQCIKVIEGSHAVTGPDAADDA